MLGRLLLLFLLTPAVELGMLIQVDRLIGFPATIGLIVATGIVGSYLARREGLNTWHRLNERLNRGDLPGTELIDGVIILVAGALLVTPGVLTDAVGFLGLLPPTRALIRRLLMRRLKSKVEEGSLQMQFGFFGGTAPGPNGTGTPPDRPPSPNGSDDSWEGTGRQIPRHTDEESSDDAPPSG
ncbi:MAG: hypothetical protein BRD55_08785 [Bacteroidetes bacterium SW_9_63_38]|nr:MAG: hypothetical protein BRD55_08785 [Bacteroidetes bacterium SW_9_63_38]